MTRDDPDDPNNEDGLPENACPGCGVMLIDHDGFGPIAHVGVSFDRPCGWCSHPERAGGVCTICEDVAVPEDWSDKLAVAMRDHDDEVITEIVSLIVARSGQDSRAALDLQEKLHVVEAEWSLVRKGSCANCYGSGTEGSVRHVPAGTTRSAKTGETIEMPYLAFVDGKCTWCDGTGNLLEHLHSRGRSYAKDAIRGRAVICSLLGGGPPHNLEELDLEKIEETHRRAAEMQRNPDFLRPILQPLVDARRRFDDAEGQQWDILVDAIDNFVADLLSEQREQAD